MGSMGTQVLFERVLSRDIAFEIGAESEPEVRVFLSHSKANSLFQVDTRVRQIGLSSSGGDLER